MVGYMQFILRINTDLSQNKSQRLITLSAFRALEFPNQKRTKAARRLHELTPADALQADCKTVLGMYVYVYLPTTMFGDTDYIMPSNYSCKIYVSRFVMWNNYMYFETFIISFFVHNV